MIMSPLVIGKDSEGLPTYPSREGTSSEDRGRIIEVIRPDLASCLHLTNISKQAHWNVKGVSAQSLHLLFDEIYEYLADASDTLAERIMALGGTAQSGIRFIARRSYIPEYPDDIVGMCPHVVALADRIAILANTMAMSIERLEQIGSRVTSNKYQEIVYELDKKLWFVESHVQISEDYDKGADERDESSEQEDSKGEASPVNSESSGSSGSSSSSNDDDYMAIPAKGEGD